MLNRQIIILKKYIDKFINQFSKDIEEIRLNKIYNKGNLSTEDSNLLEINYNKAEKEVEKKFGHLNINTNNNKKELNKIEENKDIKEFESLLISILNSGKDVIENENLEKFKTISKKLLFQDISSLTIIGNFFRDNFNNIKMRNNMDEIDINNIERISKLQVQLINISNDIELGINKENKNSRKENKNKEIYDSKTLDKLVKEFRKEYEINKDYATDQEIKEVMKKNSYDKQKTYLIIMNNLITKK